MSTYEQAGVQYRVPSCLPLFEPDPEPEGEALAIEHALQQAVCPEQDWQNLLNSNDVDQVFQRLSSDSEQYLAVRAHGIPFLSPSQKGRGEHPKLVSFKATSKHQDVSHGAVEVRSVRLQKLTRRCEELVRKLTRRHFLAPIPAEWRGMWDTCCRDGSVLMPSWVIWQHRDLPDLPALQRLSAALRETVVQELQGRTQQRHASWTQWFEEDWNDRRKGTYAYIRGDDKHAAPPIQRDDGTFTGNLQEADSLVREAWLPIFCLYAVDEPPSIQDFLDRYQAYLPARAPFQEEDFTAKDLRTVLKKMSGDSAIGIDGWRVKELRALPDELLERFCDFFRLVETTGRWPACLSVALISMIDKGQGARAQDLRPISVTSVVYRMWAGFRVSQVLQWQDQWATQGIYGFRRASGTEDCFWQTALDIEHALLSGQPLFGFSLDFAKAFDRVPVDLVMHLGERAGLPQGLLRGLRGMYTQLERRFRVGRGVGTAFRSTNGIMQGCPLSVVLLNLLMQVWVSLVEGECPEVKAKSYADDSSGTTTNVDAIQQVLVLTREFCQLTGMRLNLKKTNLWSTTREGRDLLARIMLDGRQPNIVESERLLGAQLVFSRRSVAQKDVSKRWREAELACERVKAAPLSLEAKATLIETVVLPKKCTTALCAPPPRTQ